jgi:hypothetical protein
MLKQYVLSLCSFCLILSSCNGTDPLLPTWKNSSTSQASVPTQSLQLIDTCQPGSQGGQSCTGVVQLKPSMFSDLQACTAQQGLGQICQLPKGTNVCIVSPGFDCIGTDGHLEFSGPEVLRYCDVYPPPGCG